MILAGQLLYIVKGIYRQWQFGKAARGCNDFKYILKMCKVHPSHWRISHSSQSYELY